MFPARSRFTVLFVFDSSSMRGRPITYVGVLIRQAQRCASTGHRRYGSAKGGAEGVMLDRGEAVPRRLQEISTDQSHLLSRRNP